MRFELKSLVYQRISYAISAQSHVLPLNERGKIFFYLMKILYHKFFKKSNNIILATERGFEPPNRFNPVRSLAVIRIQPTLPLRHL